MTTPKTQALIPFKPQALAGKAALAPQVLDAAKSIVEAARDYARTREEEQTKRAAIAARLQADLARLQADTATLQLALTHTFQERSASLAGLLALVDRARSEGDHAFAIQALEAFTAMACPSPLNALAEFHRARQGEAFEF